MQVRFLLARVLSKFHTDFIFYRNQLTESNELKPSVTYRFTFVSLISPFLLKDLRLLTVTSSPTTFKKSTALMKQSYLLFTWFYYLKESKVQNGLKTSASIKFAFLPVRRTMYTLTKAPMAHKTNSKEQFVFRFFKFSTSIKTRYTYMNNPKTLNNGLLALLLAQRSFPIFETNVLLIKRYSILLSVSDHIFFNMHTFIKNHKVKNIK